jgi:hypothetical protein
MFDEEKYFLQEDSQPAIYQEEFTRQFYQWELRGRGWQVFPYPVELEPPYYPFVPRRLAQAGRYDDARRPTLIGSLIARIRGKATRPSEWMPETFDDTGAEPQEFVDPGPLAEIQLSLPSHVRLTKDTAAQYLVSSLAACPVSFEVIGLPESIIIQYACRTPDRPQLVSQLQAHFPEAVLREHTNFLADQWQRASGRGTVIVDFGLSQEFMRPLAGLKSYEVDPLIGICAALSDLRQGELALFQVLYQKTRGSWAQSILRSVVDPEGGSFFTDAPEMVSLAKEKASKPLFASVVRIGAKSGEAGRAWQIVRALGGALEQLASPLSNELMPLSDEGYGRGKHEQSVLCRTSYRLGMLLNCDELLSLVHPPSASVRSPKLKREEKKTRAAPQIATEGSFVLGQNLHAGKATVVTLHPQHRIRHTYVVGASGTGKTTLLLNLIIQDIQNGEGVAVLDPHGDLIDDILSHIPEKREGDVVLVDPSDEAYPVGFNILDAHSELEKNLLSSDLIGVFRRLSTSWGDQMTSVLGNAILAFLESEQGGTLADLRRFLIEADFRQSFLNTVRDSEVVYYWQKEFPLLSGKPQAPLLTRLDTFLRPKLIRYMVSQRKSKLDFGAMMNEGKIFLARLSQGAIGEENAYLLGTLLVSKFHQMAISRQAMQESLRRNFYLYIDEFHNFITPSMSDILSGARKYHLGLILAHQELRQLASRDAEVASAVIANPYTRICFRVGDNDAKRLEEGFSFFVASDLQNLGIGEAICRVERAEYDFNLKTVAVPSVDEALAKDRRVRLITSVRRKYATPKHEVETELEGKRSTVSAPAPSSEIPTKTKQEAPRPIEAEAPQRTRELRAKPRDVVKINSAEPSPLGRGGGQHKYLQNLIKRMGQAKGYKATIEKEVLAGLGSVDVALEKDGYAIACEISVSTDVEHELGNIQKCLAAGFDQVLLICSDRKMLTKAKEAVALALGEEKALRVQLLSPEELFPFLEAIEAKDAGREETVRGYKVKVQYQAVSEKEKSSRKQAIAQTIHQALKRMKGSK